MTTAFIALGANLGDRQANIARAVDMLADSEGIAVGRLSRMIETSPLSDADQPDYIDAVVCVETELTASQLFGAMSSIEDALGRVRQQKWGPRTIDLDLLLCGDEIIRTPTLTVPHRSMHLRSFVLDGMCDLAGDVIHPVLKRSMNELAERLNGGNFFLSPDHPQLISVAGVIGVGKSTLARGLAEALGCQMLPEAYDTNPYMPEVYSGNTDVALDSELYFLDSRIEQLSKKILPAGMAAVADYVLDKSLIYAASYLSRDELQVFEQRYRSALDGMAKPVVVVYLTDKPEACLERVVNRNRPYEQQLDLDTINNLSDDYERLFADWKRSPVIRLDAGRFDCLDADQVRAFADELRHYIWKSQEK
jgi:2-amino-4-hydroxy-6-hydroxymethyldihydropteridine diphosphokinase